MVIKNLNVFILTIKCPRCANKSWSKKRITFSPRYFLRRVSPSLLIGSEIDRRITRRRRMNIPDGRDSLSVRDTTNGAAAAAAAVDGAHNTIPRLLPPWREVRGGGEGGWIALTVYFFACAFRARFAAAGRREKERPELKKWNKHANAGHFPSLSLRAECKCADLTALIPATRDARDGKAWVVKGEGENFFSFALPFYCRSLKCYAVTNGE